MELVALQVKKRDAFRKGPMRRMRAQGQVPGIVYGHGLDSVPVAIETREIEGIIRHHIGRNYIINLTVGDDKSSEERWTIVRELQRDPITSEILHVDLYELKRGEEISITVPIHVHGTAPGVREGGVLDQVIREVDVRCLPKDIPEYIDVDISELQIGDAIYLSDLKIDNFVIDSEDMEQVVIHVVSAHKALEAIPEPGEEGEEEEMEEPELVGEEKEPEEEE